MIRITKLSDYGIVLMTYFAAQRDGALYNARDLAEATHIQPPFVSKILKALARAGIVDSHRGSKGGYRLSRNAEEISVAEVISALEGPIAITECIDESDAQCGLERLCPIRGNWQRINEAIRSALEEISLSEMAQPLFPRPAMTTPEDILAGDLPKAESVKATP